MISWISFVEQVTKFAIMVTVVLAAFTAVTALIREGAVRKRKNELEFAKLELEILKLSKEAGLPLREPYSTKPLFYQEVKTKFATTETKPGLSLFARFLYVLLAMVGAVGVAVFGLNGLIAATSDDVALGSSLIHFVMAGALWAGVSRIVRIYNSDHQNRKAEGNRRQAKVTR